MIPNSIVTSSARRAVETTTLVCRHSDYDKPVEVNFAFHRGGVDSYIHSISQTSVDRTTLLLIGHNPVLEELVAILARRSIKMSTCTLVQINLCLPNWENIVSQPGFKSEITNIWKP
jgi:phosphohistidine phosphatase